MLTRGLRDSLSGLPAEFWWLWASTLINRLGGFVTTFLALYLTADRGFSASFAGLVAALYGAGGIVSSVVAGSLADRVGRRPTLMVSQVATAAAMAALGFAEHPVAICVLVALLGTTANAARPTMQAIIADLVPDKDRVRAFSINYWAANIGFGVASISAGLIAEHGYLALFLGNALSVLVCAVVVFLKIPETRPPAAHHAPSAAEGLPGASGRTAGSLLATVRDGRFMALVGLSFLVAVVFMQFTTSLPVSMGQDGFSSADYGLVIGVNGLVVVLAQIPVSRAIRARHPANVLAVAALLCCYGFGLTVFAHSVPLYIATVCVWTLGEIMHNPTSVALAASLSPAHSRGRYQGVYTLVWPGATFIGPLLGGLIIDDYGADTLWYACAAVGTVAGAGYLLLRIRLTSAPSAPAAAPARGPAPELREEA